MAKKATGDTMCPLTLSRQRHGMLVSSLANRTAPLASSDHFTVYGLADDDVLVVHDFTPAQIDNNIGGYVANELIPLLAGAPLPARTDEYRLSEQETFESHVGAIVRSMDGSERRAWHLFYDNTLAALHDGAADRLGAGPPDFIADFRAIYQQVANLIAETPFFASVLDVATCFGFLPLYLAAGESITARQRLVGCDHNPALVALAEDYRRHRGLTRPSFVRADILTDDLGRELVPLEPGFDIVMAIHLLEHLAPEQTDRAMDNLWALTRRRLIIAVPFEAEADARFGHQQVFDRASLAALGAQANGRCHAFEHHGGWLVIDRNPKDIAHRKRQP